MNLQSLGVEEVGSWLNSKVQYAGVDFAALVQEELINGAGLVGMKSEDWVALGLKRGPAAAIVHLVETTMKPQSSSVARGITKSCNNVQAAKRVTNDCEKQSLSTRREDGARLSSSSADVRVKASKVVTAKDVRSHIRAAFPNFWIVRFNGPNIQKFLTRRARIVERLYGPNCPDDTREAAEKEIGRKLTSLRRSVRRRQTAFKEKLGSLERRYIFGTTLVELFAYGRELKEADQEFFTELHKARVQKPHSFMEKKIATAIVLDRVDGREDFLHVRIVNVVKLQAGRVKDLLIPFAETFAAEEDHPSWVSQIQTKATVCWPECCTWIQEEDEVGDSSGDECETESFHTSELEGPPSKKMKGSTEVVAPSTSKTNVDRENHLEKSSVQVSDMHGEACGSTLEAPLRCAEKSHELQQVEADRDINSAEIDRRIENASLPLQTMALSPSIDKTAEHDVVAEHPCKDPGNSEGDDFKLPGDWEEKLKLFDIDQLKIVAGVLLQQPASELSLMGLRSYAAAHNKSVGKKEFAIAAAMRYSKALLHIATRAISTGMLNIRASVWDGKQIDNSDVKLV